MELAKRELPLTFVAGEALPDKAGRGFESLFGAFTSAMYFMDEDYDAEDDTADGGGIKLDEEDVKMPDSMPPEERVPVIDLSKTDLKDFLASSASGSNIQVIDPDDPAFGLADEVKKDAVTDNVDLDDVKVNPSSSGWGDIPTPVDVNGSWDEPPSTWVGTDGGWDEPPASTVEPSTTGTGWDAPIDEWKVNDSGWYVEQQTSLMDFMGPTILPSTHTTGIVERSTRQIIQIVPAPDLSKEPPKKKNRFKGMKPEEIVEEEFERRFGYIVVAPWKKVGNHSKSDIDRPRVLPDSRGPSVEVDGTIHGADDTTNSTGPVHNVGKDHIKVLLAPESIEKMTLGFGLVGTWVQIARKVPSSNDEPVGEGKTKRRGKGRKKGGHGVNGEPTQWWYLEQLSCAISSFHTDKQCD